MNSCLAIIYSKAGKYRKPTRPCPCCGKEQTRLTRHLKTKHHDRPEVQQILNKPDGSKEQQEGFNKLRKYGIDIYNRKQSTLETPTYIAERKGGDEQTLVQCSKCKGFYKRNLFYRHKEVCTGDTTDLPRKLELDAMKSVVITEHDKEFCSEILSRFHRDDVGNICRSDETLLTIGKRLFQVNKRKVEKDMEIRKSVMQDMRQLARIYMAFKIDVPTSESLGDMFIRGNFTALENAIDRVTKDADGKLKYGLKNSIYYLLRTSVDYLKGYYRIREDDKKADDLDKFVACLVYHRDIVFGDASYAIEMSRLERLRIPEIQPLEDDIETMRNYTVDLIKKLTCEYRYIDLHEYITLRDALCSRITLYNARRGGEPSRLKVTNFTEAKSGRWTSSKLIEKLPDWERRLFDDILITYQPGKGTHLVPVLLPADCITGLDILCSPEIRKRVKILDENIYLFPNTGLSKDHTSGWNATSKLAKEAGVKRPDLLNATKQRHRISTLYCALEIPEADRQYFYKHMGHTKEVNWGTYQYPLPVMEITKVARHLEDIDKGM